MFDSSIDIPSSQAVDQADCSLVAVPSSLPAAFSICLSIDISSSLLQGIPSSNCLPSLSRFRDNLSSNPTCSIVGSNSSDMDFVIDIMVIADRVEY